MHAHEVAPARIFAILAAVTLANWAAFDRTRQGVALAVLCAVSAPVSEVLLNSLFGLWHYPRADLPGMVSWCAPRQFKPRLPLCSGYVLAIYSNSAFTACMQFVIQQAEYEKGFPLVLRCILQLVHCWTNGPCPRVAGPRGHVNPWKCSCPHPCQPSAGFRGATHSTRRASATSRACCGSRARSGDSLRVLGMRCLPQGSAMLAMISAVFNGVSAQHAPVRKC